jgi:CDP-diacylglycerol--glycerol-3-phosphate 3-phosphatidyltransferase
MFRHVPNLLTGLRLVLAMVFFCMLAYYQYEGRGDPSFLWIAFIVYLVALITDFLDGFLARRWKVEGAFGRIVDPFVDKILVLGSFTFFAGKNFIIPETVIHGGAREMVVKTLTGVAPGIVVILLARELLVTSLRGSRIQRQKLRRPVFRQAQDGRAVGHHPGHPGLRELLPAVPEARIRAIRGQCP